MSDSQSNHKHKEKKIKKHKKQKKEKKHKQHKQHKQQKQHKQHKQHKQPNQYNQQKQYNSHRQQKNQQNQHISNKQTRKYYQPRQSQDKINQYAHQPIKSYNTGDQQVLPERTHVNCRRCKNPTFSLKTRSCSSCGYPKQTRPAYFPVQKQIDIHQMIKQGKLVHNSYAPVLIQVVANDRMGKKQKIKCCPTDSIFDFKKLISAQIGTRPQKIRLQKANIIFKDHLSLDDYQIKDGMGLQMYYD